MEETKCKPKGVYQNAHMSVFSAVGRSSLSFFFFFFFFFLQERKEHYVFDSRRCRGGEREGARESGFYFLTMPVCHHSGRQRQTEVADRPVTFRNQLIAQQRNEFHPRQLRCSRLRSSAFSVTEWRSSQRRRADSEDTTASKRRTVQRTYNTSDFFSVNIVNMHVHLCLGVVSCDVLLRPDVGSRANDALSVSQIWLTSCVSQMGHIHLRGKWRPRTPGGIMPR